MLSSYNTGSGLIVIGMVTVAPDSFPKIVSLVFRVVDTFFGMILNCKPTLVTAVEVKVPGGSVGVTPVVVTGDSIIRLALDDRLAKEIVENARQRIINEFAWEKQALNFFSIIK